MNETILVLHGGISDGQVYAYLHVWMLIVVATVRASFDGRDCIKRKQEPESAVC